MKAMYLACILILLTFAPSVQEEKQSECNLQNTLKNVGGILNDAHSKIIGTLENVNKRYHDAFISESNDQGK